jgi:hypothetical protein
VSEVEAIPRSRFGLVHSPVFRENPDFRSSTARKRLTPVTGNGRIWVGLPILTTFSIAPFPAIWECGLSDQLRYRLSSWKGPVS